MLKSAHRRLRLVLISVFVLQVCQLGLARTRSHATTRGARAHSSSRISYRSASSSKRGRYAVSSRYGGRSYSGRGGRYARAEEYRGHGRWRRKVVVASGGAHVAGIHNFLTESWADSQGEQPLVGSSVRSADGVPMMRADGARDTASSPGLARGAGSGGILPSSGPPFIVTRPVTVAGSAAGFGAPTAVSSVPTIVNPLVSAFTDTLAEKGFYASDQGFIVETMDGQVLAENNADQPLNPASVTKVATSLVAISKFGPDFRFRTTLYTDGKLDPDTGILHGSLYVIGGADPALVTENAFLIADQLNQHGVRTVEGNLVVQGQFYFNFSASRESAAKAFRSAMTPDLNNIEQSSAYQRFLSMKGADAREAALLFGDRVSGQHPPVQEASASPSDADTSSADGSAAGGSATAASAQKDPAERPRYANQSSNPALSEAEQYQIKAGIPYVKVLGETITQPGINTGKLALLAVHTSLPLMRVLKGQNDFSNNWMATVIGEMVGGPDAVDRFLENSIGLRNDEVRIVTSSGLGSNLISPRAMAQILRKLTAYLGKQQIGLDQLLPVAGVDHGTLERRYNDAFRGSVVAKTGTLHSVSALAGVANTRGRGPLVFVIFNHGGSPATFRIIQDETLRKIITLCGGPVAVR
jgi:D-alanyl-D-alanine carboxypeptidase/D-alanyl-D-alanine-endopeptidase (penicillin-binding protein 4)